MRLPRGIFVKLVSIFLVIGLVPFLALSLWTYDKAKDRMTATVTEYWLVRQARETAAALDREVQGMRTLIRSWADDPKLANEMASIPHLTDPWGERSGNNGPEESELLTNLRAFLERRRNYRKDLDLILLVRADGLVVAESSLDAKRLRGRSLAEILPAANDRRWIEEALHPSEQALAEPEVPVSTQDWHLSSLVAKARGQQPYDLRSLGYPHSAHYYAVGFAGTIVAPDGKRTLGALVGLFNWRTIQGVLDDVVARFESPDNPLEQGSRYASGYPFLFSDNRDTIIAHKNQEILGDSLADDHNLGDFSETMAKAPYGGYEYEYPKGTKKLSGYAKTVGDTQGGFGWVVGVGINDNEIFADVYTLRDFMIIAVLIVTGMVILLAAVFSHRITEPITRLIAYTEEVARGNLTARVDIRTNDEIAVLADSFNKMAEDLGESNRRLIKAEKDAAWQEMARQVAHEIKNPLTPIMLSAQQLKKAHSDHHPAFDEILTDSVDTIVEQCEGLKKIASDFSSFASFTKRTLQREDIANLVQGAVDLYKTRVAGKVEVRCSIELPRGTCVDVDKDEIRRVFLNLFNNAMEAMKDGGRLTVTARPHDHRGTRQVRIDVSDTGRGIRVGDRARLFEPYFSTRTGGTGLGLAICQRIIQEHGGAITVESEVGTGTTFTISLPEAKPKEG